MFRTEKLSNTFGVSVWDLKLQTDMPKHIIQALESLILEHKIVVFKGQDLTPKEQIQFCKQFGSLHLHPLKSNTCKHPEMTILSNISEDGNPVGYPGPKFKIWHSDMCYESNPPKFSFLYAQEVPNKGGQTFFANSTLAYEELDLEIKNDLAGKSAIFGFSKKLMDRCKMKGYDLVIEPEDQSKDILHPVFMSHPITRKKSIFVNWTHTDRIVGLDEAVSMEMLNKLFTHCECSKYVYKHRYDKGDLMVWDNRATLHTGDGEIEIDSPRIMRRVVVNY